MHRTKAVLTLLSAVAFLLSPFLSSGFAGFAPDQFPIAQVDPPVQPAGYAFSIWGLIYILLLAGAAFGAIKRVDHPAWDAARWPLIASLLVGAAWIPINTGIISLIIENHGREIFLHIQSLMTFTKIV